MRISFPIEIADADDVFESLRAHRAGVHPQSTPDRARNSFHPFQSTDAAGPSRISYLFKFRADSGSDFVTVEVDLIEIAAAWMHHHTADAAIAHEQIRTAADDEKREIFPPAKANQFGEGVFIARLDPKLGRTADAQRRVLRKRLIKANVPIFADNFFQFLGDDEIGGQDRQLLVNVSSAEAQDKIARVQDISDVAMHPFQTRLITDATVTVGGDFIGDNLPSHPWNWCFVRSINIRHHNPVRLIEGAPKFRAQSFRARVSMRLKHGQDTVASTRSRRLEGGANFRGMVRVIIDQQETIARVFNFKTAPRMVELAK